MAAPEHRGAWARPRGNKASSSRHAMAAADMTSQQLPRQLVHNAHLRQATVHCNLLHVQTISLQQLQLCGPDQATTTRLDCGRQHGRQCTLALERR
jgi:hypothetical protein